MEQCPRPSHSGDIILVRALEVDPQSNQVGAGFYVNGTVINPEALKAQLDNGEGEACHSEG